jgi:hemerythrin-like domain-containing protein
MEALDQTHREMLQMLDQLDALLAHLDDQGPDARARELAGRILQFFNDNARAHHAAEEAHVFPRLLAGPDEALAAQVRRLQQDHGWLEEDWLLLAPQLEALATGYSWYDLDMLKQALPVFRSLLQEHIALEESMVYPAARRQVL